MTNRIIKQALHPYPDDLVIVTKVGGRRGEDKSWLHALSRQDLIDAVYERTSHDDPACGSCWILDWRIAPVPRATRRSNAYQSGNFRSSLYAPRFVLLEFAIKRGLADPEEPCGGQFIS